MKYKTVFIDWNGTLSHSRFWDRLAYARDEYSRYEQIQNVLFHNQEGKLIVEDWMRGLRSAGNVLQYLHDRTGIPINELESELRYSSENMRFINAGVIEKIQTIRANGTRVVIATDNMDTFRHLTVKELRLNELFDGILTSDTAGALKTDIDPDGSSPFFRLYLAQNELSNGDAVIIDDSEDTRIVESFGIDFLHVKQTSSIDDHLDVIILAQGI